MNETTPRTPSEFEKAAADTQGESLASEFWAFLAQNKKWWLAPIVIVMLLPDDMIAFLEEQAARKGLRSASEYLCSVVRDVRGATPPGRPLRPSSARRSRAARPSR